MVNVVLVQFRGIRAVARASDRLPPAHPRVAHSPTNRRTYASEQRCKIAYSSNNMSNVLKNSWAHDALSPRLAMRSTETNSSVVYIHLSLYLLHGGDC